VGCNYTDFGQLSTDCGTSDNKCYEKCKHTTEIAEYTGLSNADDVLQAMVVEHLQLQEQILKSWCELELDICTQGTLLGFPCVQCGQVYQKGFSPCASKKIECDGSEYLTVSECQSVCVSPCQTCVRQEVDFNATQEGQELYSKIIEAIKTTLVSVTNVSEVDNFISKIWAGSKVVKYEKMKMYIYLGRDPTDFEVSVKSIIEKALPLPIGTTIEFLK